ncbi:hypothetical protein CEP52_005608 [Fusarium oligoseptatum]|uniref:Uncharacterized protein n=1 Tax=Fusarium oligoseptatum TaxID=2604345 RepID=A0A428TXF7_9HYPO|nr:hypothetical protein CEP52_005608 [Fusarium oligoseptatum]
MSIPDDKINSFTDGEHTLYKDANYRLDNQGHLALHDWADPHTCALPLEYDNNESSTSFTSGSRGQSGIASRTRSTSPAKNSDDLLKLEKPVTWSSDWPLLPYRM